MVNSTVGSANYLWQFQNVSDALGVSANRVVFKTEGTITRENSLATTETDSGTSVSYGATTETISITKMTVPKDAVESDILDAIKNKKNIKVWRSNLSDKDTEGYKTEFAYVAISSVEESESTGDNVEFSFEGQAVDGFKDGRLEIDAEIVQLALYGFEKPGEFTGDLNDPDRQQQTTK